jgi:general secretion pathway protein H
VRDNRGFTLIEVLVVLVIIGVIVGLASIALGDNRAEELQREARRLQAVLTLATEEAIVKSRELGVRFDADGYRFFMPNDEQAWVPVEHDREFAARQLPRPLELTLLTDARAVRSNDRDAKATPHVYFFTTGELYPAFELILSHPELETAYRLEARIDGKIELHAER